MKLNVQVQFGGKRICGIEPRNYSDLELIVIVNIKKLR